MDKVGVQNDKGGSEDASYYTVEDLEMEKKRIQDEFNTQRAKMKELFLQKEAECGSLFQQVQKLKNELDDAKSQLVVDSMTRESNFEVEKRKAEEEIATLQRLVHETIEESSSTRTLYDNELGKLKSYIQHLQNELAALKQQKQQSPHHTVQEHSLAPSVVLNALTKGIAKKLGADTFSSQDAEENLKKTQEDAEVLRSLVEPLEDQIKALKEKLRSTDEQLQKCKECGHVKLEVSSPVLDQSSQPMNMQSTTATNTSFESQKLETNTCDMCCNYEAQLVGEQKKTKELEEKVLVAEKAVERHKEDLLKEIGFRKEMEEKWNEKKEEHKQQVAELTRSTECTEQDLKELKQLFSRECTEMRSSLLKLTREREMIQLELHKLQKENDTLVGKYELHSQELQSEAINLPSTVEELHELVLKNHQELIMAKIGKEAAEEKVNNLHCDIVLLKDQITIDQNERKSIEETLDQEIKGLRKQINHLEREKKLFAANQEKLVNSEKTNQTKITELETKIEELTKNLRLFEANNIELKNRVHSLQQELDTTETVQKDFVRLSQSLQVQLEKIRESDTQVRWQFEEDVDECPACRSGFSNTKRKQHCRHCGQIFCQSCLTRTVQSGPRMRPSKVCDVCHTLLVKSSAPYFSEAPPMT